MKEIMCCCRKLALSNIEFVLLVSIIVCFEINRRLYFRSFPCILVVLLSNLDNSCLKIIGTKISKECLFNDQFQESLSGLIGDLPVQLYNQNDCLSNKLPQPIFTEHDIDIVPLVQIYNLLSFDLVVAELLVKTGLQIEQEILWQNCAESQVPIYMGFTM